MCPLSVLVLLLVAQSAGASALHHLHESQETVPVRRARAGRVWKRSQETPSFTVAAFDRNFTLDLSPDTSFLSPALRVQRIRGDGTRVEDASHLRDCFYSGTVDQEQDSVVAVSLCGGMRGSFITRGEEYVVEPQPSASSPTHAHIIRRRIRQGAPGLGPGQGRQRRFVSAPRYIETLLVADSSMVQFHGDELQHYILMLISVAAQLYKHPSIKNSISMVVVKVLVVEDEELGPTVSSNGGVTLRNFCAWQQFFNPPSQRHPEHYDTALLFTREDICGHWSCDTLGVADVGTMCDAKRSCSVIEDNGLQAAFTAAHELGHVLSMPHDDSRNCETQFGKLGQNHMMAPLFVQLNQSLPWSPCSALYVTEFFDNGHGDCLLDVPEKVLPLPTDMPGQLYSLDQQCQQTFGEEFIYCPNNSDVDLCSQLWCREQGQHHCTTKNGSLPWADGTTCGPGQSCLSGVCLSDDEVAKPREVIDGAWGPWGPWGPCSRSCGGGVEFSYRECNDPIPQNGGRYCEGQRLKYQSCNTQACKGTHGKSFREEQCEKYSSPSYLDLHGGVIQWIPKYAGVSLRDRCKLVCRAKGSSEFKVFDSKVIDGTTCGPDTTSMCIQGQCVKAGCDMEIGSNKKMDKCGVCDGNGNSCRKITGSLNKAGYGYTDIVTIPAGATNIDIKQRSHRGIKHDGHYLAIRGEHGACILNGNFSVSTVEQDIPVQGAVLKYSGSSTSLERIQSFGQLHDPITIQLLASIGEAAPPKVKYTFYLPKDVSFSKSKEKASSFHAIQPYEMAQWTMGEWSECSKTCGSGWSRRDVECWDSAGFLSNLCDSDTKPADIQPCGDVPCPIWQMGPWSSCSRTCGQGERRRSVFCIDYMGKVVEPERCDPAKHPSPVSGQCMNHEC